MNVLINAHILASLRRALRVCDNAREHWRGALCLTRPMRYFLLFLLLLIGLAPGADAFSRAYRPVGDYVRESPLVIVADISTREAPQFETVFAVREILKNESKAPVAVGQILKFPIGRTMWIVPREAQNAVVVMAPEWDAPDGKSRPVSEVYRTPEQLLAVRALIGVYEKNGERAQLLALQTLAGQGNAFLDEQLLADLRRMRKRENFSIALESFDRLDAENQARLLQWLGTVGDARALPLLIQSLDAPDRKVWGAAAHQLIYDFPDAPGVQAALQSLASDAEKRPFVVNYLRRHDPNFVAPEWKPTTWMRAQQALDSGDKSAARTAFFTVIAADDEPKYGFSTIHAARELVPLVQTETDKTRLRAALISRLVGRPNYASAAQIIELLRQLPDASHVAALLPLLVPPTETMEAYSWHEPTRAATFALLDLGADARQSATQTVVQSLRARAVATPPLSDEERAIYSLELAWLADDASWKSASQIAPAVARQMAQLEPLRAAAQSKDEARALAALLPDSDNRLQNRADIWVIARLGELRDSIAVAPLLAELKRAPYSGRDQEFKRALVQIGGEAAREGALKLLDFPEPSQRALGMDILRELPDFDVRPLLLKIIAGENVPDKTHAIFLLGYVGTPQDLPVLRQLADFWTSDLAYQSRAADAVTGIVERYPPAA